MTKERRDVAKSELGMIMGMSSREYHREYQRKYRRERHDKCIAISRAYRQRKAAERGPITATCAVCGKTFVKTGHFQVCCSSECARLRKNEKERMTRVRAPRPRHSAPITAVCPVCGKTFTKSCNHQKYCSKRCKNEVWNPERNLPKMKRTCPICGKEFETARSDKVFCSKACYKAARHRERQPVERVCVFCGKAFKSMSRTAKYCSTVCSSRFRKGYATLADFEKAQAERKAAHNKQYERDRNGLTLAQIQEVIAAQDGDPSLLFGRSQSWTKAQRKYAQKRYEENHGLFSQTWNP